MLKRFLLYVLAAGFLVLGLIGLVIPVLPGVLFLLLAAVCVSGASPRIARKFQSNRHWRRYQRHWQHSEGMSLFQRSRLALWLSARALVDSVQRPRS